MDAVSSKAAPAVQRTSLIIILAVSASHLLNDLMQFLLPALYPLLKDNYGLNYLQIGLILGLITSLLQTIVLGMVLASRHDDDRLGNDRGSR